MLSHIADVLPCYVFMQICIYGQMDSMFFRWQEIVRNVKAMLSYGVEKGMKTPQLVRSLVLLSIMFNFSYYA
jgi:hypothetical protein